MRAVDDLEIGVMFWAGPNPRGIIQEVKSLGVRCGQMGIPGDYVLEGVADEWRQALEEEDFALATLFAAYNGESYADIPAVQRTVGFIPPATRAEREQRTLAVSDFAAALGAPGIATHIGFVPEDENDPDYVAVRDMVRRVCDHAANNGQTFALETGQEPAPVLLRFFKDVGRDNLRINFDPANMILYGTGEPLGAFEMVAPHVVTVHCKDGDWPPKDQPDALGTERPLGQGSVGIERFIGRIKELGYRGSLHVEREGVQGEERLRDIRAAVKLLQGLR